MQSMLGEPRKRSRANFSLEAQEEGGPETLHMIAVMTVVTHAAFLSNLDSTHLITCKWQVTPIPTYRSTHRMTAYHVELQRCAIAN